MLHVKAGSDLAPSPPVDDLLRAGSSERFGSLLRPVESIYQFANGGDGLIHTASSTPAV